MIITFAHIHTPPPLPHVLEFHRYLMQCCNVYSSARSGTALGMGLPHAFGSTIPREDGLCSGLEVVFRGADQAVNACSCQGKDADTGKTQRQAHLFLPSSGLSRHDSRASRIGEVRRFENDKLRQLARKYQAHQDHLDHWYKEVDHHSSTWAHKGDGLADAAAESEEARVPRLCALASAQGSGEASRRQENGNGVGPLQDCVLSSKGKKNALLTAHCSYNS